MCDLTMRPKRVEGIGLFEQDGLKYRLIEKYLRH